MFRELPEVSQNRGFCWQKACFRQTYQPVLASLLLMSAILIVGACMPSLNHSSSANLNCWWMIMRIHKNPYGWIACHTFPYVLYTIHILYLLSFKIDLWFADVTCLKETFVLWRWYFYPKRLLTLPTKVASAFFGPFRTWTSSKSMRAFKWISMGQGMQPYWARHLVEEGNPPTAFGIDFLCSHKNWPWPGNARFFFE